MYGPSSVVTRTGELALDQVTKKQVLELNVWLNLVFVGHLMKFD